MRSIGIDGKANAAGRRREMLRVTMMIEEADA